jgi:hypothetical protein
METKKYKKKKKLKLDKWQWLRQVENWREISWIIKPKVVNNPASIQVGGRSRPDLFHRPKKENRIIIINILK